MGFDPQAFTAAFMNKLSEGIDERGKEAKELFTEELEKADRNVALFKTRLANMNSAKNIADKLKELGATDRQIMYYAKDLNPLQSLKEVYTALEGMRALKAKNVNYPDLTPDLIAEIMNLPEEFSVDPEDKTNFWKRTFNLTKAHEDAIPSEGDEDFMGNILFAAMNINPRERVRRRLEDQKYLGDYSIADINRMVAQNEYSDVFGGEYGAATMDITKIPPVVDYNRAKGLTKYYNDIYEGYMNDESNRYTDVLLGAFGIQPQDQDKADVTVNGVKLNPIQIASNIALKKGPDYIRAKEWAQGIARQRTVADFSLRPDEQQQVPVLMGNF